MEHVPCQLTDELYDNHAGGDCAEWYTIRREGLDLPLTLEAQLKT
jgi:hypothetical protein